MALPPSPSPAPAAQLAMHAASGARDYWLGHAVSVAFALACTWGRAPAGFLLAWTLFVAVFAAWRTVFLARAGRATPDAQTLQRQWRLANAAPALWGALLGLFAIVTFPYITLADQFVLTLLLVSNAMLGAINSAAWATGMRWHLAASLGCGAVAWGAFGRELSWTLCLALLAIAGFCELYNRRQQALIRDKLALARESETLAERLLAQGETLRRSGRAMTQLIASASHDIRQPVHGLGMIIASWDPAHLAPEDQRRLAAMASRVALVSDMLTTFLDLSRLEHETYTPHREPATLRAVLQEVVEDARAAAERKGLRLDAEWLDLWVLTDALLLRRIVSNLLVNAIKYTHAGHVALRCLHTQDGGLALEVSDTGMGIAPQFLDDVFLDYFTIERADIEPGFGLGLAIVRRFALLLGYQVTVQSQEGHGTRMRVGIPASALIDAPARADTEKQAIPVRFRKVLLVEDDPVARGATAQVLRAAGHEVAEAESPDQALQWAEAHRPEVIVSDYHLSHARSGLGLIADIRAAHPGHQIAAFLLTGDMSAHLQDESRAAGVRLLFKPLAPSRLQAAVTELPPPDAAPQAGVPARNVRNSAS